MPPDIYKFERWKRNIYPRYWIRKSLEYGLDSYCRGLLTLLKKSHPKSAFELAIGTGYPFAEKLLAAGIDIAGCDISNELIADLKKSCPSITSCIGGYEDLDQVKVAIKKNFDLVYCLRSTWYFTDIAKAIDFMIYFVRPGGRIIFDIMNKDSKWNKAMVEKKNRLFLMPIGKNIIKFALNWITPGRYIIDTLFGVREIMYYPSEIEAILKVRGFAYETFTLAQIIESCSESGGVNDPFSPDQKLIYVVHIE